MGTEGYGIVTFAGAVAVAGGPGPEPEPYRWPRSIWKTRTLGYPRGQWMRWCGMVRGKLMGGLGFGRIFLPAYSPGLNPAERYSRKSADTLRGRSTLP